MRRHRKSVASKADSAEKKLNKMSSVDKNLQQQVAILASLREQIRTLDIEITNEGTSLGDLKRVKAREWMGVLFGGLLECSEKGVVVAKFGRAITGYVPTEATPPGFPRANYPDRSRRHVESLVAEAERTLHEISFIGEVRDGALQLPNEFRVDGIHGPPPSTPTLPVQPATTTPQTQQPLVVEEEIVLYAEPAEVPQAADDNDANRCAVGCS